MSTKTQGTSLYAIDPDTDLLLVIGCVTNLTGVGAEVEENEVTCLEDESRSYEPGMVTPAVKNFTILFDPSNAIHMRLYAIYLAKQTVEWAVGLSDGTAPAVVTAGVFVLPTTRTWIEVTGYMSNFPFDFALGTRVSIAIPVRTSGIPVVTAKV